MPTDTRMDVRPLELLAEGTRGYEPYLLPSGEMSDPVLHEPTQYGTPYHAWCQAVLAKHGDAEQRDAHRERATRGLDAALAHVADPAAAHTVSGFDRRTGALHRINHRDFFWPAVLRTYRTLVELGVPADRWSDTIAKVDIERSFGSRPPSNWAAVWMSGEWLRQCEGLSPISRERFDQWLGGFAERILLERGMYEEPGHSNSYDLFTRLHLADILSNGYDGTHRDFLERLLVTGLKRSLGVQLSNGSLASAHRSTGQSWTLGAQTAYFTLAANRLDASDPPLARKSREAGQRALIALMQCRRRDAPFSPVENALPPAWRVGYEPYTADGHYGNLALGFLAHAIDSGMSTTPLETAETRDPQTHIESDPVWRGVARHDPYAVQLNGFPAASYDGFGLVDMTFGPGRALQFVSSAAHLNEPKQFFNVGLALRPHADRGPLQVLSQLPHHLIAPLAPGEEPASLTLRSRLIGGCQHDITVTLDAKGIHITEATPGLESYKTLLVPYLRDPGHGSQTHLDLEVDREHTVVRFTLGSETVRLTMDAPSLSPIDLPHGFENRRGLCGLLRLDLAEPCEQVTHHWVVEK